MLMGIRDKAFSIALNSIKDKYMNSHLEGIGVVKSIAYKDGKLILTVVLEGLEDHPLSIEAGEIEIAPDGSTIKVGKFNANIPFANNALNRFATNKFNVPEGGARTALKTAKTLLGL